MFTCCEPINANDNKKFIYRSRDSSMRRRKRSTSRNSSIQKTPPLDPRKYLNTPKKKFHTPKKFLENYQNNLTLNDNNSVNFQTSSRNSKNSINKKKNFSSSKTQNLQNFQKNRNSQNLQNFSKNEENNLCLLNIKNDFIRYGNLITKDEEHEAYRLMMLERLKKIKMTEEDYENLIRLNKNFLKKNMKNGNLKNLMIIINKYDFIENFEFEKNEYEFYAKKLKILDWKKKLIHNDPRTSTINFFLEFLKKKKNFQKSGNSQNYENEGFFSFLPKNQKNENVNSITKTVKNRNLGGLNLLKKTDKKKNKLRGKENYDEDEEVKIDNCETLEYNNEKNSYFSDDEENREKEIRCSSVDEDVYFDTPNQRRYSQNLRNSQKIQKFPNFQNSQKIQKMRNYRKFQNSQNFQKNFLHQNYTPGRIRASSTLTNSPEHHYSTINNIRSSSTAHGRFIPKSQNSSLPYESIVRAASLSPQHSSNITPITPIKQLPKIVMPLKRVIVKSPIKKNFFFIEENQEKKNFITKVEDFDTRARITRDSRFVVDYRDSVLKSGGRGFYSQRVVPVSFQGVDPYLMMDYNQKNHYGGNFQNFGNYENFGKNQKIVENRNFENFAKNQNFEENEKIENYVRNYVKSEEKNRRETISYRKINLNNEGYIKSITPISDKGSVSSQKTPKNREIQLKNVYKKKSLLSEKSSFRSPTSTLRSNSVNTVIKENRFSSPRDSFSYDQRFRKLEIEHLKNNYKTEFRENFSKNEIFGKNEKNENFIGKNGVIYTSELDEFKKFDGGNDGIVNHTIIKNNENYKYSNNYSKKNSTKKIENFEKSPKKPKVENFQKIENKGNFLKKSPIKNLKKNEDDRIENIDRDSLSYENEFDRIKSGADIYESIQTEVEFYLKQQSKDKNHNIGSFGDKKFIKLQNEKNVQNLENLKNYQNFPKNQNQQNFQKIQKKSPIKEYTTTPSKTPQSRISNNIIRLQQAPATYTRYKQEERLRKARVTRRGYRDSNFVNFEETRENKHFFSGRNRSRSGSRNNSNQAFGVRRDSFNRVGRKREIYKNE